MDPVPVPGVNDDDRLMREVVGFFDAPSFIRRAKRVEESYRQLVEGLARKRREQLEMVRLRLGQLRALAGDWAALQRWVPQPDDRARLQALHDERQPRLRLPLEPTTSARALSGAVAELKEALEAFNARWEKVLAKVDVGPVNAARDAYNRYYIVEKECALGASRAIREGFRAVPPLTPEEVRALSPTVSLPEFRL